MTLETASENAGRAALKAKNTSTSKKPWNASFRSTHSDVAKQGLSKCRVECAEASPSSTDRRGLRQRAQNSRQRVIDEQSVSGCGDLGLVAEKKEKKNSGRKPRSECSDRHMRRRAEETREGEGAARVGRDGGSRGGRDQRERRVCGVRMIDNGRYKVDSVRSGRPMRKMVHCQFFVVSDSTDRPKGESASQKWWRVIQAADGRKRGERWEGTDALPCGAP